jgi:hypothetical protein
MKVWLAHYAGDYEPGWIVGVYATAGAAKAACERDNKPVAIRWTPGERDPSAFIEAYENTPGSYAEIEGLTLAKGYGYTVEPMEVQGA